MNCYIVTLVSQSNDFVIAVVEDEEEAKRVAAECEADSIPEDIQDVYGYYGSRVTGVQIIHVENGRPVSAEMVREFEGGQTMKDHFTKLEAWLRGRKDRGCELDMAPNGNPRATVYGINDDDPLIERTAPTLREAFERAVDALEED